MPTNPYSSVSISGYNSSPPPDDGSRVSANELTWAKHKTKLGDPLKTQVETIDARVVTAFGKVINTDADENNLMGGSLAFTEKIFTISSGAIAPTRSNVVLAAEGGTADILDKMTTGSVSDDCLAILSVDAGDTITINDAGGAAGQIHLVDSQDLVLSGNDRLFLIRDGADWYEIARAVDNQQIVQVVHTETLGMSTGTTEFPAPDDTIPQIGEGDEYMTATITPTDSTNRLVIEVIGNFAHDIGAANFLMALFQDAVSNALACVNMGVETASRLQLLSLRHEMAAGTTSAITFRIRAGRAGSDSGTTTFNGASAGRLYGGVVRSHIRITEYRT